MEYHSSIGNRFRLSKKEIITKLEEKMRNRNINFRMIREVDDMCKYEPWDLRGLLQPTAPEDQQWYLFNPISSSSNIRRITNEGRWRVTGNPIPIYNEEDERIGEKRILVYYKRHDGQETITNWKIHEFHSVNESLFQDPFVLCRLKKDD